MGLDKCFLSWMQYFLRFLNSFGNYSIETCNFMGLFFYLTLAELICVITIFSNNRGKPSILNSWCFNRACSSSSNYSFQTVDEQIDALVW